MPTRPRRHSTAPAWLWAPAVIGVAFLLLPIVGMVTRIDLGHLGAVVWAEESRLALLLSLLTSSLSALVSVLVGFPLGYLLATHVFPGQRLVRTLILLPLVLPPVVSGLALLYTWGRSAYLGSLLTEAGLGLAYTTAAVVVAQVFVSLPFMVMSVETAVAARGQAYELAAAELGASPGRVFLSVTLPMLRPAIMVGAVLCFARSLGEFGATLTFAGSLSGVTRTMPLQIYLVRESDPQSAIALSLLLIGIALLIIVAAYRSPHAPRMRRTVRDAEGERNPGGPLAEAGERDRPIVEVGEGDRPLAEAGEGDLPLAEAGEGNRPIAEVGTGPLRDAGESEPLADRPAAGDVTVAVTLPERDLDVALDLPGGTTTAIIGRNGAGKTSLFQTLTGALPAETGALRIGDRTIFDLAAEHWPPIHARGIVHLAQNPLLFPHLTVVDNVAFGLRARGHSADEARSQAERMLSRLGVGECANRRPDAVSGGQAARIALARALVTDPALLLLDEPLAALDVDVRVETRAVLAEVLAGRNAMLITHDLADVTALATSLVLIDSGSVASAGPVGEIDAELTGPGGDFLRSFCRTEDSGAPARD